MTPIGHLFNQFFIRSLLLILFTFVPTTSFGLACSVTFPQGLNGAGTGSEISINSATVTLNNQTAIPAHLVNLCASCSANCDGGSLCAIQSEVPSLGSPGAFQSNSGGSNITVSSGTNNQVNTGTYNAKDITVNGSGTLNFISSAPTDVFKMRDVVVEGSGILVLNEGNYYMRSLEVRGSGVVILGASGNVRLYIKDYINVTDTGNINNTNPSNDLAHRLFVYVYGDGSNDSTFSSSGQMDAILYFLNDPSTLTISGDFQFRGALTTENEVFVNNDAVIVYQPDEVDNVDTGGLCDGGGVTIDHFVINHSSQAVYCLPTVVTVSARDGANQIITDFDQTVILDTGSSRGTWTPNATNGTFSDSTADDGLATYTFADSDNGVASFNLDYKDGPPDLDLEVYLQSSSSIRDDDSEGLLRFAPSGFVLTDAAIPSSPTGTPASYHVTQTAGISDIIHITAYGQLPFGACGVIESYAGNKDIKFWMDYTDPNSGQGVVASIDTNPIATSLGGASTQNVAFTLGRASVNSRYRDVGLIKIHAQDDATGPTAITGATDNFVVKPAQFAFTSIRNIDGNNNTAPTDANGDAFSVAGENFTVRLTVQDNDGNTTPNYGNESSPEGILLSSNQLIAPAGGRNGSADNGFIENGTVFNKISNGVFEGTTFQFDEVGIIELKAEIGDQDYLGGGNVVSLSNNVGRFIPARLAATRNSPQITASCSPGGFSYLNTIGGITQNFNYTDNVTWNPQISVEAQEKGDGVTGTITQNYTGTFFKLDNEDVTATYSSNTVTEPSILTELLNLTTVDNMTDVSVTGGSGIGTVSFTHADGFGFEKNVNGTNTTNFNAEIQLLATFADADGVEGMESGNTDIVFGGTTAMTGMAFLGTSIDAVFNKIYQGRMMLENVAGSELSGLVMPMRAEYFNGTDFLLNGFEDFSCTNFVNASNIIVTGTNPSSVSVTVNSVTQGAVPGLWNIHLNPPSPSAAVEADIEADLTAATGENLEHLQHDWPSDGIDGLFDDNPQGKASFGIFAGEENLIFIKEIFN